MVALRTGRRQLCRLQDHYQLPAVPTEVSRSIPLPQVYAAELVLHIHCTSKGLAWEREEEEGGGGLEIMAS